MPDTKTVQERHDAAMERIAKVLGTTSVDLTGEARGDPALARAITMENIAAAVDKGKTGVNLRAAVKAARDEDLMTLPGVGEKSLPALREWATATQSTTQQPPVTAFPPNSAIGAELGVSKETVQTVAASEAPEATAGKGGTAGTTTTTKS